MAGWCEKEINPLHLFLAALLPHPHPRPICGMLERSEVAPYTLQKQLELFDYFPFQSKKSIYYL